MRPFESIAELGVYLRLLLDIRDTLDRFLPVGVRPFAQRTDRGDGLAQGVPGDVGREPAPPPRAGRASTCAPACTSPTCTRRSCDIQQQRMLWQRFVAAGVTPEVPVGIADVQVAYQQVAAGPRRTRRAARRRRHAAARAPADRGAVSSVWRASPPTPMCSHNLQERSALCGPCCATRNSTPLLADLAARHVPEDQVAAELELAWWQSALESLLAVRPRAARARTPRCSTGSRRTSGSSTRPTPPAAPALLGWQLAENWKIGSSTGRTRPRALKRIAARAER